MGALGAQCSKCKARTCIDFLSSQHIWHLIRWKKGRKGGRASFARVACCKRMVRFLHVFTHIRRDERPNAFYIVPFFQLGLNCLRPTREQPGRGTWIILVYLGYIINIKHMIKAQTEKTHRKTLL